MARQRRHALIIGIDEYPNCPQRNQLKTCVADANLMACLLEVRFGFPSSAIRLLRNGEASRNGICDAMEELIHDASGDDIVVIHYSGHGSQKREARGTRHDEGDRYDETIVPYDSGRMGFPDPHENRDIVDDEIHDWLLRLHTKTPNVTLIFDSCHAGTITRRPSVGVRRAPRDDSRSEGRGPVPGSRKYRSRGRFGDHHVLIAACREDENAHEYPEKGYGALTYFVHQELLRARAGDTYRDVFERLAPQVTGVYRKQRPQLEGTWDREIFGIRDFKPMRYVAVQSREGDHVVLEAGKAHGLSSGSEWSVYPAGTRGTDIPASGKVRLTALGAIKSRGEILQEDVSTGPIGPGSRAVELTHVYDDLRWTVEIRGGPPAAVREALERALGASPLLDLAAPGEIGDARIHYLTPDGGLEEVPQLCGEVTSATWAAVGRSGALLLKPSPGDRRHVGELIQGLGRWCRQHYVGQLRNHNPGSVLEGRVAVGLLRQAGAHWRPVAVGEVFEEGERLAITLTNAHDAPLYLSVLDLGLTGAVSQIYPVEGAHEALEAGETLEIGIREGDEIEAFLPDVFPIGPRDRAEGESWIKVFATARQADFRWLTQRSAVRGNRHPLEQLLRRTLHGTERGGSRHLATDDWTTVERSFTVRRS